MNARDEANKLYSELSDTYQTALAVGVDRIHPNEMEDARNKVTLAAKSFRSTSDNVVLSTVKSFYTELMPKLKGWMAEGKKAYPNALPPPKVVSTGDVDFLPTPGPSPYPGPMPASTTQPTPVGGSTESRPTPWYLAGGVDWRVIGGVVGSLLALTLLIRKK